MARFDAQKTTAAPRPDREPGEGSARGYSPDFATLRGALESGRTGVWSWDIAADVVTWSDDFELVHSLPPESFAGTHRSFAHENRERDRPKVASSPAEAVRTGLPYLARYQVSSRDGGEGRWIEASGMISVKDDRPERMVGLCRDVTERVNLEQELRSRIKQQEALAQLGERALAEPDLEKLLNDAASTVALTLPVDFVEVLELMPGETDLVLRAGFGWKAGCIGSIVTSCASGNYARHTLDSAVPLVIDDFAAEKRFKIPQYLRDHGCVSGMSTVIAGRDGRAYGVLGICAAKGRVFGIAHAAFLAAVGNLLAGAIQRRQLEQRHELMIRELRHRSGNLFSQLLALFSQTARNSKTMADLEAKYRARVLAMANAHRLITEAGWKSTALVDLLRVVLGPYLERISFAGPNVDLEPDPTFSLGAALHELADNAVKHGSLSRQQGRLELSWSVGRAPRGVTLTFNWIERNGRPARRPRRPRRSGFGSRLIGLVIERQMNGEVHRTYGRDGLSLRMIVPLTHERWPTQPAAPASRPADA